MGESQKLRIYKKFYGGFPNIKANFGKNEMFGMIGMFGKIAILWIFFTFRTKHIT